MASHGADLVSRFDPGPDWLKSVEWSAGEGGKTSQVTGNSSEWAVAFGETQMAREMRADVGGDSSLLKVSPESAFTRAGGGIFRFEWIDLFWTTRRLWILDSHRIPLSWPTRSYFGSTAPS